MEPDGDVIDGMLADWARERPDLDPAPLGVVERIMRAAHLMRQALDPATADLPLSNGGFAVLEALRRAGAPHALSPSTLFRELLLSSGAMTNRIDKLEMAGLVERQPDPHDRRGLLIALTPEGLACVDGAMSRYLDAQARLLAPLTAKERKTLATALRTLLRALE